GAGFDEARPAPGMGPAFRPGLPIHSSNLEPATDTISAGTFTVNGTDGADTITLDNGTSDNDGLLRIQVNGDEPIQFSNKTNVVINGDLTASGSNDTITLDFTEVATGLQTVTVNGGSNGGGPKPIENINIVHTPTGVTTSVNGDDGSDNFQLGGNNGPISQLQGPVVVDGGANPVGGASGTTATCGETTLHIPQPDGDTLHLRDGANASGGTWTAN